MDIIKAYATNNLCYKAARPMKPKGIVVHSTGANNPNLKRYVDAPAEVGINQYGNHWNVAKPGGQTVCVHAFIGYDKNKNVRVAEILPLNICCWGVGSGHKGSYNYDPPHIQFEICEDGLKDKTYYRKAFDVAVEYCAHLCKTYGLSVHQIVGHVEAYKKGYGSNHSDPEHWMKNFGETMNDFRKQVSLKMAANAGISVNTGKSATSNAAAAIKDGDLVSVAANATYYNGQSIPSWVKSQKWFVLGTPKGDRVVLDKNEAGTNAICSPVNAKFLTVVRSKDANCCPYTIRVTEIPIPIYKGAGTNTGKTGSITGKGVYTIVEEKQNSGTALGKLKSGAGWIDLRSVQKIDF